MYIYIYIYIHIENETTVNAEYTRNKEDFFSTIIHSIYLLLRFT